MSLVTLLRPNQKATSAEVLSSACRGYIVQLDPDTGGRPRMLQNLWGRTVHFKSLQRVREALRRRGVRSARLVQHHACEELGAPGDSDRPEPGVPVLNADSM